MSRRRILYVEGNRDGTVGGSHRILFDLIRHLDPANEPVVAFYQDNPYVGRLQDIGVETVVLEDLCALEDARRRSVPPVRILDFGLAILRRRALLRRLRVDLLHLNNSIAQGNDDWLPAAWLAGIPCVVTAMGDAKPDLDPVHRWLAFRFARVICISEYLHASLAAYGYPQDRLVLAQTGVDLADMAARTTRSRAEIRQELAIDESACMVAMVGNLRHWKGQHLVVEALTGMSDEQRRSLVIVFVGDTAPEHAAYAERLRAAVDAAGLAPHVRFAGHRDDVPDIFAAADIALHASVEPEPFGLVLVEAMAAGLPVVAADLGGPGEVVTESTGIRFRTNDPASLADALTALARDPDRRARMGALARDRAAEFDIAGFARRVEAAYAAVAK